MSSSKINAIAPHIVLNKLLPVGDGATLATCVFAMDEGRSANDTTLIIFEAAIFFFCAGLGAVVVACTELDVASDTTTGTVDVLAPSTEGVELAVARELVATATVDAAFVVVAVSVMLPPPPPPPVVTVVLGLENDRSIVTQLLPDAAATAYAVLHPRSVGESTPPSDCWPPASASVG